MTCDSVFFNCCFAHAHTHFSLKLFALFIFHSVSSLLTLCFVHFFSASYEWIVVVVAACFWYTIFT